MNWDNVLRSLKEQQHELLRTRTDMMKAINPYTGSLAYSNSDYDDIYFKLSILYIAIRALQSGLE